MLPVCTGKVPCPSWGSICGQSPQALTQIMLTGDHLDEKNPHRSQLCVEFFRQNHVALLDRGGKSSPGKDGVYGPISFHTEPSVPSSLLPGKNLPALCSLRAPLLPHCWGSHWILQDGSPPCDYFGLSQPQERKYDLISSPLWHGSALCSWKQTQPWAPDPPLCGGLCSRRGSRAGGGFIYPFCINLNNRRMEESQISFATYICLTEIMQLTDYWYLRRKNQ